MSYSITSIEYLEPHLLRKWFTESKSSTGGGKFSVIDVRDYDHIGGHIRNSLHFPSNGLDASMDDLISQVENSDDIVFHCALSQQRGPSAALKFLRSSKPGSLDNKNVWILRGGFAGWQALYGEDSSVTDKYQKDIWKFGY